MRMDLDRFPSVKGVLENQYMTRRMMLRRSAALGFGISTMGSLLAACGEDETDDDSDDAAAEDESSDDSEDAAEDDATDEPEDEPADDDQRSGGEIRFVTPGEVGSLDTHAITQAIVGQVAWNMFEHLFTWDEEMQATLELADGLEISDDGLTATIPLREGVLFHNGEEMTSADVVASMNRWTQLSGRAGNLPDILAEITEVDDYTIQLDLSEPFGALQPVLCRQNAGCAIFPKAVMDEIGTSPLENEEHYIGTGPYQFVEWQPDRHIHIERFADYVSRQEEPSGYAGLKHQYLDDIFFVPVGDMSASVAGLQAGDYDYVAAVPSEHYETLDNDENIRAEVLEFGSFGCFVFNFRWGILSGHEGPGLLLRQAMLAALDHEEIAIGTYGEGFYTLHPGVAHLGLPWRTEVGEDLYHQNDPDKARELMDEAGYDGEEIIWMVARDQPNHFASTEIAVQQWQDVGFNVELEIYDWATIGERRLEEEGVWNGMTTAHSFRPDPVTLTPIAGTEHYGWWDSPRKNEASAEFQSRAGFEERLEAWEEIVRLWYEEVPRIKVADSNQIDAWRTRVQGWPWVSQVQVHLANLWVED